MAAALAGACIVAVVAGGRADDPDATRAVTPPPSPPSTSTAPASVPTASERTGPQTPSPPPGGPPPATPGSGPVPVAVSPVATTTTPPPPRFLDGRWVAATEIDGYWGDDLVIDVAEHPWGPWTTVTRRSRPRHDEAAVEGDVRRVRYLAAILRIADALDGRSAAGARGALLAFGARGRYASTPTAIRSWRSGGAAKGDLSRSWRDASCGLPSTRCASAKSGRGGRLRRRRRCP